MSDVDVWGARARENLELPPHGWLDVEWLLQSRVWPKLFGSVPAGWWAPEVFQNLGVPTGGKWLSLGCGAGHAEIALARSGSVDEVLGMDPSVGAISVAKELAQAAGVADKATFAVSAMDFPEFEPNSVDVVHMNMSLHHIHDLEWVFAQIFTALRPGGYFVANEFMGPRRFQWPEARLKIVTDFLALMPERLRRDYRDNTVKTQQETHPTEWWIAYDPTESVRSDDIIPLLKKIAPDLKIRPYGGNIANLVLENIIHNFDPNNPEDRAWMDKLWVEDDKSIAAEGSDFNYIVASKSHNAREMATAWELAARWMVKREREGQDAANLIASGTVAIDMPGAWTQTTTAVSATSGTITTATGNLRYKKFGRTVVISVVVPVTTNGSGSGALLVALPFTAGPGTYVLNGRETSAGKVLAGSIAPNSRELAIMYYDGSYPGTNGAYLTLSGIYEVAA
jgi:SAM-dependent methyltransferase